MTHHYAGQEELVVIFSAAIEVVVLVVVAAVVAGAVESTELISLHYITAATDAFDGLVKPVGIAHSSAVSSWDLPVTVKLTWKGNLRSL